MQNATEQKEINVYTQFIRTLKFIHEFPWQHQVRWEPFRTLTINSQRFSKYDPGCKFIIQVLELDCATRTPTDHQDASMRIADPIRHGEVATVPSGKDVICTRIHSKITKDVR